MLEAQPLHRVRQFDVDAKIVGIQLELIAFEQPAILIDVHDQGGDVAIDLKLPMPVARRIGLKIDMPGAISEDAIFTGHGHPHLFLGYPLTCIIMHVLAEVQSYLDRNMHFASCSADFAEFHPIRFG